MMLWPARWRPSPTYCGGAKDTQVAVVTVVLDLGSASLAAAPEQETLLQLLQSLSVRMYSVHVEDGKDNGTRLATLTATNSRRRSKRTTYNTCFKCGQVGHYAKGYAAKGGHKQQDN